MSAPELAGVLPVLATPFTADLDLDLESLAKLTQWQVDAGAGGVAVFGFASEGFALSGPERARIIGVVREVLPPSLPLIAGVSATGTAEAVVLADEAAPAGSDGAAQPERRADFYLGPLRAVRPNRVSVAAGASPEAQAAALLSELGSLRHGPWWPPLDEVFRTARGFYPGSLAESAAAGRASLLG